MIPWVSIFIYPVYVMVVFFVHFLLFSSAIVHDGLTDLHFSSSHRQRQTNAQTTPFALAQRYLPRELLQELRMTPPVPVKKRRKATASSSRTGAGGEDEEVT